MARNRVTTRSPVRAKGRTDGRWLALLPNWVSAIAGLLSAGAAVIGLILVANPEETAGQPAPRVSLANVTKDPSGIYAQGPYEGLVPREHDVALMMRPESNADSEWLVVVANRDASVDDVEPEDGTWSASAPVASNSSWLVTAVIIPATPDGAAADGLLKELGAEGPVAPSVIEAAGVRSVD